MPTIKDKAKAYEPKQTKNITDLEVVRVDAEVKETTARDKEGKEFTYNYITIDDEEYRLPDSVLKDLKVILESKPDLSSFQVKKTGTGFNTKYTVIPLA